MESVVEFFEKRSVEVVGREFPQILLIHANQLNADVMPELLAMFRRRGYRIVTLAQALKDRRTCSAEQYVGRGGFSWIHRWSRAGACPARASPSRRDWAQQAQGVLPCSAEQRNTWKSRCAGRTLCSITSAELQVARPRMRSSRSPPSAIPPASSCPRNCSRACAWTRATRCMPSNCRTASSSRPSIRSWRSRWKWRRR